MNLFKIIGIIGLLFITTGILIKKRKAKDIFYVIAGLCLEIYSIYLGDIIFAILQIVFISTAGYDLTKIRFKKTT
ncbi:MAG: hypothetical protein US76_01130 [Parcubacteria group bacterium GW2011_GWA2_38_13b]|nr:MAG: hypothetical protein US76_01130 [Parcubacteria group bacterium GW2011_GWA2_38_13b]